MQEITLPITGMSCMHCVKAIESVLDRLDGVEVLKVEIGSATIRYDEARINTFDISEVVREEGYSIEG